MTQYKPQSGAAIRDRERHLKIFHKDMNISVEDLAKHYEMCPKIVASIVLPKAPSKKMPEFQGREKEIYAMWVSGISLLRISKMLGCRKDVPREMMNKYVRRSDPERYKQLVSRHRRGGRDGTGKKDKD